MLAINEMVLPSKARMYAKPEKQTLRLVIGDKQKCLACPKSKRLIKGKFVNFPKLQLISDKYEHEINCPQREKF